MKGFQNWSVYVHKFLLENPLKKFVDCIMYNRFSRTILDCKIQVFFWKKAISELTSASSSKQVWVRSFCDGN